MEIDNDGKFGIVFVMVLLFVAFMIDMNALTATIMTMLVISVACIIRRR